MYPLHTKTKTTFTRQPAGSKQTCSRGGGGRRLRAACVYLYKKDPLKKSTPQGLLDCPTRYIRKAHRLFLSLIDGIVGYTYRIISKIRVP